MAFSSGTYTLPGPALASGDTVSSTENNTFRNDMATAFNLTWLRNGTAAATANIPMGTYKFTGLGAGTTAGDSVRFEQLPSATNLLGVAFGGTGVGTLTGLVKGNGTSAFSAATAGTDYLAPAAIGVTVQGYDANTAKTNVVQSFSVAQRGTITALTDASTITPDFAAANNFSLTIGGNRTLANPTNLTAGQSGVIVITQDGTGSRTLAYGSYWKFASGVAPTLTTTASAVDVLAYYVESSTRITARLISDVK